MSELLASLSKLPPEQEAIRDKCFHPSGTFGHGIKTAAFLFDLDSGAIVAILGVLKTRKVCVALDPSSPRARKDDSLKDSQANLILTNNGQQTFAYELTGVVHAHRNVIHSVIV